MTEAKTLDAQCAEMEALLKEEEPPKLGEFGEIWAWRIVKTKAGSFEIREIAYIVENGQPKVIAWTREGELSDHTPYALEEMLKCMLAEIKTGPMYVETADGLEELPGNSG